MRKILYTSVIFLFCSVSNIFAQIPQNVNTGNDKEESIWTSTAALIFIVIFIVLMIVSRSWSKSIQAKRDQLTKRNESAEEGEQSDGDKEN